MNPFSVIPAHAGIQSGEFGDSILIRELLINPFSVIPAHAGIQCFRYQGKRALLALRAACGVQP